jgi:septal ring factor EnvC (AmiA/AmiB activator)
MNDSEPDDARLRSTEEQMRRALGLRSDVPASDGHHPPPINNGLHPPRRRFVHDGEVPVTVVRREHHHDGETGTNQLEAARQAIRSQAAAKERAERALEDAQVAIRDLQTKLGHERLAKVEALDAVRQAESDRQAVQQTLQSMQADLAAERVARRALEEKLRAAEVERQVAERRLREAEASAGRAKAAAPRKAMESRSVVEPVTPEPVDGVVKRRRGRPPKVVVEQESDIVEWWKPGWQKKFR